MLGRAGIIYLLLGVASGAPWAPRSGLGVGLLKRCDDVARYSDTIFEQLLPWAVDGISEELADEVKIA